MPARFGLRNAALSGVFCACLLLLACSQPPPATDTPAQVTQCGHADDTAIAQVQGTGNESPLLGREVVVHGIVTHVQPGRGLFLEQPLSDTNPASSDALYIDAGSLATSTTVGDELRLSGRVAETGSSGHSVTSLVEARLVENCGSGRPLPESWVGLPLSQDQRESLEGMRVSLQQSLLVNDVHGLLDQGRLGLSLDSLQWHPLEHQPPGPEAAAVALANQSGRLSVLLPEDQNTDTARMRLGDLVSQVQGVLTQDRYQYPLLLETWVPDKTAYWDDLAAGENRPGQLRVMSLNLQNLFNGDGQGGGFPTARGARNYQEYQAQLQRLGSLIILGKAQLLALQEIENDGYEADSALAQLVEELNRFRQNRPWRFARPATPRNGGDAIATAIIYDSEQLEALGPAQNHSDGPFAWGSRAPLMQLFRERHSGFRLRVVSNHFKSKGSCPRDAADPNADQGDFQACWNQARLESAMALHQWLAQVDAADPADGVILMGDFNAYRQEDPIRWLRGQGWVPATEARDEPAPPGVARPPDLRPFSYIYHGERGTLDYLFLSPSLQGMVVRAAAWHANTPYPNGWQDDLHRASDHDPVWADLWLRRSTSP